MKSLTSITLMVVLVAFSQGSAEGDDFQLGVEQANAKIQKYEQAPRRAIQRFCDRRRWSCRPTRSPSDS